MTQSFEGIGDRRERNCPPPAIYCGVGALRVTGIDAQKSNL
jgi:hypothetical protein